MGMTVTLNVICLLMTLGFNVAFAKNKSTITIFTTQTTWNEAYCICQYYGMDILMAKTQDTMDVIKTLLKMTSVNYDYWFGLYNNGYGNENTYNWIDGSTLGTWNYWDLFEPDNQNRHKCVRIAKRQFQWRTMECNRNYEFVCLKETGMCTMEPDDTIVKNENSYIYSESIQSKAECIRICEVKLDNCFGVLYIHPSICFINESEDPKDFIHSSPNTLQSYRTESVTLITYRKVCYNSTIRTSHIPYTDSSSDPELRCLLTQNSSLSTSTTVTTSPNTPHEEISEFPPITHLDTSTPSKQQLTSSLASPEAISPAFTTSPVTSKTLSSILLLPSSSSSANIPFPVVTAKPLSSTSLVPNPSATTMTVKSILSTALISRRTTLSLVSMSLTSTPTISTSNKMSISKESITLSTRNVLLMPSLSFDSSPLGTFTTETHLSTIFTIPINQTKTKSYERKPTTTTPSSDNQTLDTYSSTVSQSNNTVITTSSSISLSQTPPTKYLFRQKICGCPCIGRTRTNYQSVQAEQEKILENLSVDKTKTVSFERKRFSTPDNRKSAVTVGTAGVVIICLVIGLVVLFDISRLVKRCTK